MTEKFIAISTTRFIKTLRPFLNIEKSKDIEYIKRSGKSFIGWHPTANTGKPLWEYYRKYNLPCYFVERGAFPNTVVIDPDGFLCDSSSYGEKNWNYVLTTQQEIQLDDYLNELKTTNISLEYQKSPTLPRSTFYKKLNLPDKEIVFVPLQLEGDTVIKLWSDWAIGVEHFYRIVCSLSEHHKDKIFLVKPHPLSKLNVTSKGNVVNADIVNYKDCLNYCNKVLTINSGIGCQAMAWNKPVIIAGNSWYHFNQVNYKAHDAKEINDLLRENLSINEEKARRFLYFLKFKLYSDCIQTKKNASRFINRTDDVKYVNVRIFKQ